MATTNTKWKIATLKTGRHCHGAVAIDEQRALVVGGYGDDNTYLDSVEVFDISTGPSIQDSTTYPFLNTKRHSCGCVKIGNRVFVIGGHMIDCVLKSVECLDLDKDNISQGWTYKANMNTARYGFGVAAHDNYIYVFGGTIRYGGFLSSVERYDVENDKWTTLNATMNQPLSFLSAVTVKNTIYLIGGREDNYDEVLVNTLQVFDVETEQFETNHGENMPKPLKAASAFAIGKWIVACAGYGSVNESFSKDVFLYDTENDTWQSYTDVMNDDEARHSHAAVVLNGTDIVLMGGLESINDATDSIVHISFQDLTGFGPYKIRSEHKAVVINDSPKYFPDRLEYRIYAEALVELIKQMSGTDSSFCVSLDAPWGAGKTFLYKLIKALLQNKFEELENKKPNAIKNNEARTFWDDFREKFTTALGGTNIHSTVKLISFRIKAYIECSWERLTFPFQRNFHEKLWDLFKSDFSLKECRAVALIILIMANIVIMVVTALVATCIIIPLFCLHLVKNVILDFVHSPSNSAFRNIVELMQRKHVKREDKVQNDEVVRIAAMLILSILVWIPLWMVFFILNFINHIFYCIGEYKFY